MPPFFFLLLPKVDYVANYWDYIARLYIFIIHIHLFVVGCCFNKVARQTPETLLKKDSEMKSRIASLKSTSKCILVTVRCFASL